VVALTEPGATAGLDLPRCWVVRAAGPAGRVWSREDVPS